MLTRLKVNGFKNLVDVDVRFGPFTCIAGANGVGKSNLFDAILFLSALANSSFIEAAQSVREGGASSIRNLFHRVGNDFAPEMSFEAEMIVPPEGVDDLEQPTTATSTFLRYSVTLKYRMDEERSTVGSLELIKEELAYIKVGEASKHLLFDYKPEWRTSTILGRRFAPYFISTDDTGIDRKIKLHQDSKGESKARGRSASYLATKLSKTVLSTINTNENPTALMARREMASWRMLQLEPSALRRPDSFVDESRIGSDGSHLSATLYRLAHTNQNGSNNRNSNIDEEQVYSRIANRLSELIDDVRYIRVDRNEMRELLTLQMTAADKTSHFAQSLSDGTLRFLALAVMELDPIEQGVICMEEPENGIHPARIPAMLRLLKDIAVDTEEPIGPDNPLRQVIINTHSPSVVQQIKDADLLVAESREMLRNGKRFNRVRFSCLSDTWRTQAPDALVVARGTLLSYLNPVDYTREDTPEHAVNGNGSKSSLVKPRRVIDRPDLQPLLPGFEG